MLVYIYKVVHYGIFLMDFFIEHCSIVSRNLLSKCYSILEYFSCVNTLFPIVL